MQGGVLSALRTATAATHRQVEDTLDLLDPELDRARLRAVLERMYGFWAAHEASVDAYLAADPRLAESLQWARRARRERLRADVRTLGGAPDAVPVAEPLNVIDAPAALGWLYVAEGSTLGGAVLARKLAPLTDSLPAPLRFFAPYPEGPGPMWLRYGQVAEGWARRDPRRIKLVAQRGQQVFGSLAAWVAPLRREAVA